MNKIKIKRSTDLMDRKYPTHMKLMQTQKVNLNVHFEIYVNVHIDDHINVHTNGMLIWMLNHLNPFKNVHKISIECLYRY